MYYPPALRSLGHRSSGVWFGGMSLHQIEPKAKAAQKIGLEFVHSPETLRIVVEVRSFVATLPREGQQC
jgi:hypothetical protein